MQRMHEEAWQRVKEVFHEAVTLSVAEREVFVQQACADDPAVLAEDGLERGSLRNC